MSSLRVLGAFLRRDWLTSRSYKATFYLAFVQPFATLFLMYFIAPLIDDAEFAERSGFTGGYFGFVALGIALMGVFEAGVSTFAETVRRDQQAGTLEVVLASPASPIVTMIGSALFAFLRAVIGALLTVLIAIVLFGLELDLRAGEVAPLLLAFAACVVLFGCVGILIAAIALVIKQTLGLVGAASLAITLLAGIYYPTTVLPGALEAVADALPITWGLDVIRAILLGGEVETLQLAGVAAAAVVSVPLAVAAFHWSVDRARREGSLALY